MQLLSNSAFASYHCNIGNQIPTSATLHSSFPKYTSLELVADIQQNYLSSVDIQYHGLLLSNARRVPIHDGTYILELSKNGHAPWNAAKNEFVHSDLFSIDDCFNRNVSFRRDFHNSITGIWEQTHLTSVLVPAWLCLTVCNSQFEELPRCYFKNIMEEQSNILDNAWSRYRFSFRFAFSDMAEDEAERRGCLFTEHTIFSLICDNNIQTSNFRIAGSFGKNMSVPSTAFVCYC